MPSLPHLTLLNMPIMCSFHISSFVSETSALWLKLKLLKIMRTFLLINKEN